MEPESQTEEERSLVSMSDDAARAYSDECIRFLEQRGMDTSRGSRNRLFVEMHASALKKMLGAMVPGAKSAEKINGAEKITEVEVNGSERTERCTE